MTRKRITVQVAADGTMTAATSGVAGPGCLDEVARIEALCGEPVTESHLTDDFNASASTIADLDAVVELAQEENQ